MSATNLQTPILDGGIYSINFFNGRLLTGEDLSTEQAANKERQRRFGLAMGAGIAFGLEVFQTSGSTVSAPVITVTAGAGINRQGQTLELASDTNVALVTTPTNPSGSNTTNGDFAVCDVLQNGTYIAGEGVYLLTLAPAGGTQGRAQVSGLANTNASCNTNYLIDGVQFRLLQLNLGASALNNLAQLRNIVAHLCFGTPDTNVKSFQGDLFGPQITSYGLLDSLRPYQLSDYDIPLAVLCWTASTGLSFIDMWAVRRRITHQFGVGRWTLLASERRKSEAEAMFLQFQNQVEDMRATEPTLADIVATQRFVYLPPVGIMPIKGSNSAGGFDYPTFFGEYASHDVAMTDENLLQSLLHESYQHEPIDLSSSGKIQLYLIWENVRAVQGGHSNQLVLVFASHTLPYRGVARFGYARWGLSRFAPQVI